MSRVSRQECSAIYGCAIVPASFESDDVTFDLDKCLIVYVENYTIHAFKPLAGGGTVASYCSIRKEVVLRFEAKKGERSLMLCIVHRI